MISRSRLYYTNSTFSDDPTSDERIHKLRALVDASKVAWTNGSPGEERAALPLALAVPAGIHCHDSVCKFRGRRS